MGTGAGILVLVANSAVSFGYLVSCLASSTQVALAIAAPMSIPLLLFGGFFLKNGSVPDWLGWIGYLSWFMYGNEALTINQWRDVQFTNSSQACTLMSNTISLVWSTGRWALSAMAMTSSNNLISTRAIYFATFSCWLP